MDCAIESIELLDPLCAKKKNLKHKIDLYEDVTMIPIGCKAQLSRHIEIVSIFD